MLVHRSCPPTQIITQVSPSSPHQKIIEFPNVKRKPEQKLMLEPGTIDPSSKLIVQHSCSLFPLHLPLQMITQVPPPPSLAPKGFLRFPQRKMRTETMQVWFCIIDSFSKLLAHPN